MKNDLLRKAREDKGWSQAQLAEELGVGETTVRSWESGRRSPSLAMRSRLCDLFGMTAAQLGLEQAPIPKEDHQEEEVQTALPVSLSPQQADQNCLTMIKRVDTRWISGVLAHSLYQGTFINLHLREQSDAVVNPWAETVQESSVPPRPLPASTRLIDVYDHTDGAFLLLGEPGAGKTTLLLELTRDLLERAKLDETRPIPVVFNLSSWAQKRLSFPDWMVEELNSKYQVPHRLAEKWVWANQILPLLDGLDEVLETERIECVQAINAYRKEHGFLPMVVCSRANEYLALHTRIALSVAIAIEPLTLQQIEQHISQAGERLKGLKTALEHDANLQEVVSTPLMLTVISLAFQNTSLDALLSLEDPIQRRTLIFEKYVEVVLKRRGPKSQYSSEQTVRWLTWLAQKMQEYNQSEFYLERMQPDWLPDTHRRQKYHLTVNRVIFGLLILGSAGLFALFRGDSFPNQPGLFFWLGGGKGSSVLGWMSAGLGSFLKGASSITLIFTIVSVLASALAEIRVLIPTPKALRHAVWRGFRYGCLVGVSCGVFSALLFSRTFGSNAALLRGIIITCFTLLVTTLMVGLSTFLKPRTLPKYRHKKSSLLSRCVDFVVFSSSAMFGFTSLYALQSGGFNQTVLTNGGITSFFFGILFSVGNGTEMLFPDPRIKPAETVAWSWEAVKADLIGNIKKGIVLGAVLLVILTITTVGISTFFYGVHYGLPYGVVFGSVTGFIAGITSILTAILTGGWSSDIIDDKHQFIRPNEGIRRSIQHALFAAGVFGPIGGIASGLLSGAAFGLAGVAGWLILGTGFSIIFSALLALNFFVRYGGIAFISHYVLRWYLWRAQSLPLNAIPFLDYAAERILLRKVGGGYIFAHRLLLEYFTSLEGTQCLQETLNH